MLPTQNGVDAPHKLAELLGAAHVVGGYTRITSLLTGPGAVRHTAIHPAVQGTGALPHCAPWVPAQLARCAAAWAVRARSSGARCCLRLTQLSPGAAAALALPAPGGG